MLEQAISLDFTILVPRGSTNETVRCRLRRSVMEDLPAIFEATTSPGFHAGLDSEAPLRIEDLYEALSENLLAWQEGKLYSFTIADRDSDRLLGRIGINRNKREGIWNLGFWTHPAERGKGYMTESVIAILSFGFERLDAVQIEASYALWNKSSKRVLEKAGMRFVGYIPHAFRKRGRWVEANKMRRLRCSSGESGSRSCLTPNMPDYN
jgi:[ribosomal protein S5]-alanine N-acetyltransferase